MPQTTGVLPTDKLFRVGELDVHVRIDTDEPAFVLGLAPLKSYHDGLVDTAQ